jgi:hypothetical protein
LRRRGAASPHTTHQLPACRIEYRYHPRYGAEVRVIRAQRSITAQIDIVRFEDGEQIALPRWMLDPVFCAQLPQEPKPRVALSALLRLVDWMAAQGLRGYRASRHSEDSAKMKTNQTEHVLKPKPSALSVPAVVPPGDALGETSRNHTHAAASNLSSNASGGSHPTDPGKELQ